jgi:hypothetical protein
MPRRPLLATALSALAISAVVSLPSRADELKLKDGSKITGTIVGFEENSFKVKTSYGFAVVQKDQVVSIVVTGAPPATVSADKPATESKPASMKPPKADPPPPPPTVAKSAPPAPPPSAIAAAAPAPPPKPAAPEPIREKVSGNLYTNETYGFQMYKPPDWNVIAGARSLLPGSITAMGTDDQTTYLLIGQDSSGKSLATDMDATDHRLRDILDNFRPLGEKRLTISGVTAIERRFRGSVDQKDWSGVVVYIPRDTHVYTIFGMTLADTDLVQIQENVISRAISSLQFTK